MSRLLGLLLPLIGYTCVATVISAIVGFAYLRKSGRLDDETMFRVAALIHGVNLEEIEKAKKAEKPGVPPEEASFAEQQQQFETLSLHFDAKQKQLADSLVEFDYRLKQLSSATNDYASIKEDVKKFLDDQGKLVLSDAVQSVRGQLERMKPKLAKAQLLNFIKDDRIDEVILLLGSMKPRNREAILNLFTSPDEIDMITRIDRKILAGDPIKAVIDEKLKMLQQLKAQEK